MALKKHLVKLVLLALAIILAAACWLAAEKLHAMKRRANNVETQSELLTEYLKGTEVAPSARVSDRFERGALLTRIQKEWASGISPSPYPTDILHPLTTRGR